MALPINIEDLLNKRKIEGNRIEFKKGWNPADIYHSICAFANDFDNLGGGYILVGVEQHDNGLAKRPVAGINIEAVDGILKQMVGFNNMFDPYYLPRTSVEEVDGQQVLVGGRGGRSASAGDMGTVGREPSVCDTDGCAGQGEADEVLCSQRFEQYHCQGRGTGRIEGHG